MRPSNRGSRRKFFVPTSVFLAANQLGLAEIAESEAGKLALNGGRKAAGPAHA